MEEFINCLQEAVGQFPADAFVWDRGTKAASSSTNPPNAHQGDRSVGESSRSRARLKCGSSPQGGRTILIQAGWIRPSGIKGIRQHFADYVFGSQEPGKGMPSTARPRRKELVEEGRDSLKGRLLGPPTSL